VSFEKFDSANLFLDSVSLGQWTTFGSPVFTAEAFTFGRMIKSLAAASASTAIARSKQILRAFKKTVPLKSLTAKLS
jgi:hypothetical protein